MNNSLANFTDVLDDEICDSQPLSLTSSYENIVEPEVNNKTNSLGTLATTRPARGAGQRGHLRSIEEIDHKYRGMFTYPYFNLVQSRVIDDALYTDKSIVVCAPTGSGKTVVFEMAIVQLLMDLEDKSYNEDFKIIYMAPVKALCTERLTEWYPKLTQLGLLCIEVTGDTDVDFSQLKPYKVIITTPEKWDMLTRRWRDHKNLVEVIKLFLIDEVHILNDATRGPVLEAVVSRMKTIESSAQSVHRIEHLQNQIQGSAMTHKTAPSIRFVAVSATVSNPEDVANWLGTVNKPAVFHKFGDECRPVKLKRIVEGYPCPENTNIFKFDIILNYKLWPIIQKYHSGKPTLIFCNTRKSVTLTAEMLSKELTINFNTEQKAKLTAVASSIKNKKLQALVMSGVGCHHAGLLYEERQNIERAFRNRDLPILITTTTLAMGVNLPAHLVIIKNTQQYVNGAYQEYSISTVLQMVGRAGRPQFDTEATAVIMTRFADKARYQALVGGCEPLQSYLHKRLPENLNSEAALGTVGDVAQCVEWLRSTFLYVRAARDPRKYLGLPPNSPQTQISKKIEELCVKAMNGLASAGLITMDEASCIASTEAGRLMSIFYLDLETMKQLMKIQGTETLEQLLSLICESHELSDMHLRVDERRCLNALNRNNTGATIRFPMKGRISTRQMKLNCIIQAVLGCLVIPDPSLNQEAMKIIRTADRVCKCLVAFVTRPDLISRQPQFYSAVLNSITLAKCIAAHLWENSQFVSKQLKGIGPTFSTLLASAGKVNFMLLEESHPRDLERIMNKGAPAGNILRKQISFLPKYQLSMIPVDENTVTVKLVLLNQNFLSENIDQLTAGEAHKSYIIVGDSSNHILLLTSFKDKDLINVFDGTITHEIRRRHLSGHKIFVHCISTTMVGFDVQSEYIFNDLNKHFGSSSINYDQNETPIKDTRKKQTCITDTFKTRKRKSSSELDKAQPKEKKKRDNVIIENFKYLKKTFDIASQNVKENLSIASIRPQYKTDEVHLHNEMRNFNVEDEVDSDDFIDSEKVNSILNEIEHEMLKKQANTTRKDEIDKCKAWSLPQLKKDVITKSPMQNKLNNVKTVNEINKGKPIKLKSNYNFIELLEKNIDLSDDDEKTDISKANNGFSEAIKSQINKYIQTAGTKTDTADNNIQLLLENEKKTTSNACFDPNQKTISISSDKDFSPTQHLYPRYEIKEILANQNISRRDQNVKSTKENIENTTSKITSPKKFRAYSSSETNKEENAASSDSNKTFSPSHKLYPRYDIKEICQNIRRKDSVLKNEVDIINHSDCRFISPKRLEGPRAEFSKNNAFYSNSKENVSQTQILYPHYKINTTVKRFIQEIDPNNDKADCIIISPKKVPELFKSESSQNSAVDSDRKKTILNLQTLYPKVNKLSNVCNINRINSIQEMEDNNIDSSDCVIISPKKNINLSKSESSKENSKSNESLCPTQKLYIHYENCESLDNQCMTRDSVKETEANPNNSDCMVINLKNTVALIPPKQTNTDNIKTSSYDQSMLVHNMCLQHSNNEVKLGKLCITEEYQNKHGDAHRKSSDIQRKANNLLNLENSLNNSSYSIMDMVHNKHCLVKEHSTGLIENHSTRMNNINHALIQNTNDEKYQIHSTESDATDIKSKVLTKNTSSIPFVIDDARENILLKPQQLTSKIYNLKDSDVKSHDLTLDNSTGSCKSTTILKNSPDINTVNNQSRSNENIGYNTKKTNYCNNYSYSTTKIGVYTEQKPEYSVRVVKRIKMDLNITEIISTQELPHYETLKSNNMNYPIQIADDEDKEPIIIKDDLGCTEKDPLHYKQQSKNKCIQQAVSENFNVHTMPFIEVPKMEITGTLSTEHILPVQDIHNDAKNTAEVNNNILSLKNDESRDTNNYKYVNETDIEINNKRDEKYEVHQRPRSKLQNILQKYSKIMGQVPAPNENTVRISTFRNIESVKPSTLRSRKPFKISEIEKLQVPIPETLIDCKTAPTEQNVPVCISRPDDEQTLKKDLELKSHLTCYNFSPLVENDFQKERIPDLDLELQVPSLPLDIDLESSEDYNLDQSMLDPKTLLQCTVDNDSEEIIPPPAQFCDYTRSPSYQLNTDSINTSLNHYSQCKDLGDYTSTEIDEDYCKSIFEDNSTANLTPSREIETWTLGTEDCLENQYQLHSPSESFTVIRRNTPKFLVPYLTGNSSISTKAKLRQFKFNHKNKLRKLKRSDK